mgnify:CR=1 FL=1
MGKGLHARPFFFLRIFFLLILASPAVAQDQPASAPGQPEIEVHLDLTRQFYDALRQTGAARRHSLSTDTADLSVHHLEQIAVSARFMVETNLQLLREQAEIKSLLHELLKRSDQ